MKFPTIAIIDYGMGNLRSVSKALEIVGANVKVTGDPRVISAAAGIVFPGVGSFRPAMNFIKNSGLKGVILDAIDRSVPFLGLCLGFQLLFSLSEEHGRSRGLNVIPGDVVEFDRSMKDEGESVKVPHMGWNRVSIARKELKKTMFKGIPDRSYFYFVHSYYAKPTEKDAIAGITEYGRPFCSAVVLGNTWGCQFHPEKSGEKGLTLLKNFVREVKQ